MVLDWQDPEVLRTLLLLIGSLIPSVLSIWMVRYAVQEWQSELQQVFMCHAYQPCGSLDLPEGYDEPERLPAFIGDRNCQYNAHSPYLRCAINPSGPCDCCSHFRTHSQGFWFS